MVSDNTERNKIISIFNYTVHTVVEARFSICLCLNGNEIITLCIIALLIDFSASLRRLYDRQTLLLLILELMATLILGLSAPR